MAVRTMQATLAALVNENERLSRLNGELENDNMRLRSSMAEQETRRAWRAFDAVEKHYRHLEKFRKRRLSASSSQCSTSLSLSFFFPSEGAESCLGTDAADSYGSSPRHALEEGPVCCPEGLSVR